MCAGVNRATLLLLLLALAYSHDTDSCAGAQRAPLRISPPFKPELNALRMVYSKAQNITVHNAGNRLALEAVSGNLGTVDYHGRRYTAELADFRSPAEHVLGTTRPPVELQMYHHDEDGKTLAISLLFKIGTTRSLLVDKILRSFEHRKLHAGDSPVAFLDFGHLFKHSSDYFAYSTVGCGPEPWGHPPMDRWVVLSKMKRISAVQLQQLRKRVPELSRTTRSLNPRQATTEVVSTKAAKEGKKHISAQQKAAVITGGPSAPSKEEVSQPVVPPQKDVVPLVSTDLPASRQVQRDLPSLVQPSSPVTTPEQLVAKLPAQLPAQPVRNVKEEASLSQKNVLPWVSTELPPLKMTQPQGHVQPPSPLQSSEQLLAKFPAQPALIQPSSPLQSQEQQMAKLAALPSLVQPSSSLRTPENLGAQFPAQPALIQPTSVPQFTPEELNMASVMAGAPDDLKILPTTMPPAQVMKGSRRPAAGLLQSGNGAKDSAALYQEPSFADPQTQATMGVSPTFIPPPPFYDAVPTADPLSGSYSRPQAPLSMLTDADLAADYKKGFNAYLEKEQPKDRLVGEYKLPGATPDLPPLDAMANPIGAPDMMPNVPLEPPGLSMGGGMGGMPGAMGGMPGAMGGMPNLPMMPGAPSLSLIQRQGSAGDPIEEQIRKNDEALRKHFGNQKGSLSTRPAAALLQGEGSGLDTSADFLMQQAEYQEWFKKNQQYQKQYGGNFKSSQDVSETMKSRMALVSGLEEQQKAMEAEIGDAMHASSAHRAKSASMIRVNSTLNTFGKQQHTAEYNAKVAAREKALWAEYHHLQQVSKELAKDQVEYQKVRLETQKEEGLYAARTRQVQTMWQNMAKPYQGNPGFFLAPR